MVTQYATQEDGDGNLRFYLALSYVLVPESNYG